MKNELYSIKPLEWIESSSEWEHAFSADVGLGTYRVACIREDCDETKPWQSWRWEYEFREYYDEGSCECESAAAGKLAAWKDWQKRLLPNLVKAETRP